MISNATCWVARGEEEIPMELFTPAPPWEKVLARVRYFHPIIFEMMIHDSSANRDECHCQNVHGCSLLLLPKAMHKKRPPIPTTLPTRNDVCLLNRRKPDYSCYCKPLLRDLFSFILHFHVSPPTALQISAYVVQITQGRLHIQVHGVCFCHPPLPRSNSGE